MIRLEPRGERSLIWLYATPFVAVVFTILSGGLLFAILGTDPIEGLYQFFIAPVSSLYGLSELFVKATPIVLIAVGLALGFRANVWNIGAEGQLTLGAILGGGVALYFYDVDSFFVLPLMVIAGIAGGLAWAAIPAFLKTRFNANEILTSLMLTYVAILILSTLVHGPWRDPEGFNFPESRLFHEAALLPVVWDGTRMHIGAVIALFIVVAGWILLSRTLTGFQIRVIGSAPRAASYAGFSGKKMVWMTLSISGGLAGLAGLFEVAGPIGQLVPTISPGYGFTAIIVAFLGRLHPVGVLFAGLLVALSYLGGEIVQIELGMPQAVTGVFQGLLLFFLLASDVLIRYRIRWGRLASRQEV
ncbi:MAG: ABC transporter permease [Kiloniellales bacterium]|nr:ABC transporter permease [Kiloniellales bacterium]